MPRWFLAATLLLASCTVTSPSSRSISSSAEDPFTPLSTRLSPPPADGVMQPFTIDHLARANSPADVSFLLHAPAGKDGFIQSKDGHLFTPDGRRFRIWGVNLTGWTEGSTNIPPKDSAPLWAAEMARLGINCVRFHFLDMTNDNHPNGARRHTTAGLIDAKRTDTQHFDPEQLDRLDFFIAELKKYGIYANLNLNVGRTYKPGDDVSESALFGAAGKGFTFFAPRLLELQRDYARQLLTHINPYTRTAYAQEPAVACVELVNENSLFEFWDRNWLRGERVRGGENPQLDLTPAYEQLLTRQFNDWLKANRSPDQIARLRHEAGVKDDQPLPRLRRGDFDAASANRFETEAQFYLHIETSFFDGMKDYLQRILGVKSLIVGTADHTYFIPNQPLLTSTRHMDIVDGHVYWQHPSIWGQRNTPMVNDPLHSIMVKLARSPEVGKPYTVSEVNHPNPNEYGCEMIPLLAAYAAFQDWDGVYFYTFELKTGPNFQPFVADNFDITQDPIKITQFESGALLFLRADVQPARETVTRSYTRRQVLETMRLPESTRPYFNAPSAPAFPLSLPLRHGSRIASLDALTPGSPPPDHINLSDPSHTFTSDTEQLAWHVSANSGGLVTIDTDRTQALVGFIKANPSLTTRHLAADLRTDFAAITLSSLDNRPIATSNTLLLTTGARIENTGTKWNDRHTLWETWGTPPTKIEPVTGYLTLRDIPGAVAIALQPLDGAARPLTERPIQAKRNEDGWELPLGTPPTPWYLIQVTR